jgi:hypothetical protein
MLLYFVILGRTVGASPPLFETLKVFGSKWIISRTGVPHPTTSDRTVRITSIVVHTFAPPPPMSRSLAFFSCKS